MQQTTARITMVRVVVAAMPVRRLTAIARRGVAREKVVAVPASSANTATRSISRPAQPSTWRPSRALQASEYFYLWRLRTCSIKPKATASTR